MPKLLVLCDLDRTLFDTGKFFEEVWTLAATMYGLDAAQQRTRAPKFYDMYGTSYDYRFFDHLQDATAGAYNKEEFIQAAVADLSGRYLYDDVTIETIQLIDAIVTFGGEEYQTFKLLLCPVLQRTPRHITLRPKAEYIASAFLQPSVLIDDKQLKDEILPPSQFVRIDRSEAPSLYNEHVIRDFTQLPSLLHQLSAD